MIPSKNPRVQTFLNDTQSSDAKLYEIIQILRGLVFEISPQTTERIMYGGIMFTTDQKDWGGLFPYSSHVSFEFSQGATFADAHNILEGKGKMRGHIKYKTKTDTTTYNPAQYIKQATR